MNVALTKIALAAMLLAPPFASAELIFYKGVRRDTVQGGGRTLVLNGKCLILVDHATAQIATLFYVNLNGQKHYTTSQPTNTHFVQLQGSLKNYTAIARPPTPCEQEAGATGEGVYCSGADAVLTLNTNSSISFPKMLKDAGSGISVSQTSGVRFLTEGSFQVTFDRAETLASNRSGESFTAAFDRLVQRVESLGFTR